MKIIDDVVYDDIDRWWLRIRHRCLSCGTLYELDAEDIIRFYPPTAWTPERIQFACCICGKGIETFRAHE